MIYINSCYINYESGFQLGDESKQAIALILVLLFLLSDWFSFRLRVGLSFALSVVRDANENREEKMVA